MKAERAAVDRCRTKDANVDEFAVMRLAVVEEFLTQKAIEPRHVHVECCQLRCSPPELRIEWLQQRQADGNVTGSSQSVYLKTWLRAGELNATSLEAQNGTCSLCAFMAYEASMTPVHLPA